MYLAEELLVMVEVLGRGLDSMDDVVHGESFLLEAGHADEEALDESELRDKQCEFFGHFGGRWDLSFVVAERK
jgi:hypothetical protein